MRYKKECTDEFKLAISRIYLPTIFLSCFSLGYIVGYYIWCSMIYSAMFGLALAVIVLALVKPKIESLLMR